MSLIPVLKDYVSILDSVQASSNHDISLQTLLTQTPLYLMVSLKRFFFDFFSFQWLLNFSYFPNIVPKIQYSVLNESFFFLKNESPFSTFITFLEIPTLVDNKLFIGFANSFFLSLPISFAHLLSIRKLLLFGIIPGSVSAVGTIVGQLCFAFCILFGFRSIIIAWFSFPTLQLLILIPVMYRLYFELTNKRFYDLALTQSRDYLIKSFVLNFIFSWTEQGCIFQYFGNLTLSPEPNALETLYSNTELNSFIVTGYYMLGLYLGSFFFTTLFGFFLIRFTNYVYPFFYPTRNFWLKNFHIASSKILIVWIWFSNPLPYYNYDYFFTGPLGFIYEDYKLDNTLFSLNTISTSTETRLTPYRKDTSFKTNLSGFDSLKTYRDNKYQQSFELLNMFVPDCVYRELPFRYPERLKFGPDPAIALRVNARVRAYVNDRTPIVWPLYLTPENGNNLLFYNNFKKKKFIIKGQASFQFLKRVQAANLIKKVISNASLYWFSPRKFSGEPLYNNDGYEGYKEDEGYNGYEGYDGYEGFLDSNKKRDTESFSDSDENKRKASSNSLLAKKDKGYYVSLKKKKEKEQGFYDQKTLYENDSFSNSNENDNSSNILYNYKINAFIKNYSVEILEDYMDNLFKKAENFENKKGKERLSDEVKTQNAKKAFTITLMESMPQANQTRQILGRPLRFVRRKESQKNPIVLPLVSRNKYHRYHSQAFKKYKRKNPTFPFQEFSFQKLPFQRFKGQQKDNRHSFIRNQPPTFSVPPIIPKIKRHRRIKRNLPPFRYNKPSIIDEISKNSFNIIQKKSNPDIPSKSQLTYEDKETLKPKKIIKNPPRYNKPSIIDEILKKSKVFNLIKKRYNPDIPSKTHLTDEDEETLKDQSKKPEEEKEEEEEEKEKEIELLKKEYTNEKTLQRLYTKRKEIDLAERDFTCKKTVKNKYFKKVEKDNYEKVLKYTYNDDWFLVKYSLDEFSEYGHGSLVEALIDYTAEPTGVQNLRKYYNDCHEKLYSDGITYVETLTSKEVFDQFLLSNVIGVRTFWAPFVRHFSFYKNLVNYNFDFFYQNQPTFQNLTIDEEKRLFEKRLVLGKYYDGFRYYTQLPRLEEFQLFYRNSVSPTNKIFNHQFKGENTTVRESFAISENNTKYKGKHPVLKFDQPLYLNNDFTSYKNLKPFHEELSQKKNDKSVFLEISTSTPFYAGWDQELRKLVLTNRLLPRSLAGYGLYSPNEIHEIISRSRSKDNHSSQQYKKNKSEHKEIIAKQGKRFAGFINSKKNIEFTTWPIPKSVFNKSEKGIPYTTLSEYINNSDLRTERFKYNRANTKNNVLRFIDQYLNIDSKERKLWDCFPSHFLLFDITNQSYIDAMRVQGYEVDPQIKTFQRADTNTTTFVWPGEFNVKSSELKEKIDFVIEILNKIRIFFLPITSKLPFFGWVGVFAVGLFYYNLFTGVYDYLIERDPGYPGWWDNFF